jgi:large subunit ribosomal protein L31
MYLTSIYKKIVLNKIQWFRFCQGEPIMKKNKHPTYHKVLFVDSASGHRFVCGTTLQPNAKETFEGVEYPVNYLSISSSSHPFFTGSKQFVDSEGRVEKYNKRFKKKEAVIEENSSPVGQQAVAPAEETTKKEVKPVEQKKAAPSKTKQVKKK